MGLLKTRQDMIDEMIADIDTWDKEDLVAFARRRLRDELEMMGQPEHEYDRWLMDKSDRLKQKPRALQQRSDRR